MADLENDLIAVQTAIGKENIKILFISRFKHEGKSDKGDIRILAITPYRFYIVTTKQSPKVDFSFHILELFQLDESSTLAATLYDTFLYQLAITIQSGEKQSHCIFVFEKEDTVSKIISYSIALLKANFVNANVDKQVAWKVSSLEKQDSIEKNINNLTQQLHSGDGQSCGSFSLAYLCVCDFYKQTSEHNAEVRWDIDTIYAAHSCKDFDLEDFDRLDMKDLIPLIGALSYNKWFTRFIVSSRKLTNEVVDVIVKVIRRTLSIEEFILQDCHLNKDHIQKIALALGSNPNKIIKRIDFSKNNLEDKGVGTVAGILGSMENGLEFINLSEVGMASKGGAHVANCLKNNKLMPSTLSILNLSGNSLKIEGTQSLCEFLSQPNVLTELLLSNTECSLDLLFTALHRGCQLSLKVLDFSGNPFFGRKPKESSQSLSSVQQFFSMSRALKNVNLSNTKLPASGVKAILVGLLNNPILIDVGLDLSNNELKSSGAAELTSCLKEISLSNLNLANNGLEQDIIPICRGIQNNCSIKELDLSSNVTKAKGTNLIAESMGDILMADTPLTKLSMADSRLKVYASVLFDCLGTNDTLTFIDIRGNGIGDVGARLLAKALQINTSLREILLDRNGITAKGLHDIAQAMDRNFTLCSMPLPMTDLSASMKANNSNSFIKSYGLIEKAMIRNQSAKESSPEQAYKVHQGLLMNSIDHYTQQTDEYVTLLSNNITKVKSSENSDVQKEIAVAEKLIQEADLFRQVLLELYSDPEHSENMLDDMFLKVTSDVVSSVECVVKENIDKMLKSAANICPTALNKEEHLQKIKEELLKRSLFEKTEISSSIMKLGQSKISYKLCESNLLTATSIAEQLKLLFVDVLRRSIDKLNSLFTENSSEAQVNGDHKSKPQDINIIPTTSVSDSSDVMTPPLSTPAADLLSDITKENNFDLEWDFAKPRDTVSTSSLRSEENETHLSPAARNRMYTDSFHKAQKKKACSLKRRPTVYKQRSEVEEVEIPIESPDTEINDVFNDVVMHRTLSQISDTGSVSSSVTDEIPQRSESFNKSITAESAAVQVDKPREGITIEVDVESSSDQVDGGGSITRLPSIRAFDDVSTNTTQLSVRNNRVKPARGRRAPTNVSKLAHMASVDELLDDAPSESADLTPKPRPKSEMPLGVNIFTDESARPRVGSEKLKREPPARPSPPSKPDTPNRPEPPVKGEPPARPERPKKHEVEKKDSSAKEKKVKPPAGAFVLPQLPGLGGILKKRTAPKAPDAVDGHVTDKHDIAVETETKAKVEIAPEVNANAADVEVSKPATPSKVEPLHNTENVPPTKPPPPIVKKKPSSPLTENITESFKSPEHASLPESAPAKPAPVKKPPRGIPMGGLGGSALMAEMNKKLHIAPKTDEENHEKQPRATSPNSSAPPTTPSKPAPPKPEKPTPPQRPPSMKRTTSEAGNRPSVPNRPKSIQRPKTIDVPNESEEKFKPEKKNESSTEKPEGKTESKETEPLADKTEKDTVPKELVYV